MDLLLRILGAGFLYFIIKNFFSYLLNINSDKKLAEFKSEATAENMKNMIESNKKSNETDEIVNKSRKSIFDKFL